MNSQPRIMMLEDHSMWLEQARVSLPDAIRLGAKDQLRTIEGKHYRRIMKHVEFTAPSDKKQWWHYADDPEMQPVRTGSSYQVYSSGRGYMECWPA